MWASRAREQLVCSGKVHSMRWLESEDDASTSTELGAGGGGGRGSGGGRGEGWLAVGSSGGCAWVSWMDGTRRGREGYAESYRSAAAAAGDCEPFDVEDRREIEKDLEEEKLEGQDIGSSSKFCCSSNLHMQETGKSQPRKSTYQLLSGSHTGDVRLMSWRPQGDRLATYDSWGTINIWRMKKKKEKKDSSADMMRAKTSRAHVFFVHELELTVTAYVTDMQWSPCGTWLVLCGEGGCIKTWRLGDSTFKTLDWSHVTHDHGYNMIVTQTVPCSQFECLSWNATGSKIALGSESGEVIVVCFNGRSGLVDTVLKHKLTKVSAMHWCGLNLAGDHLGSSSEQTQDQNLSVYFKNGDISLVKFPQLKGKHSPSVISRQTQVCNGCSTWNSTSTLWAILGYDQGDVAKPVAQVLNCKAECVMVLRQAFPAQQPTIKNLSWMFNNSLLVFSQGSRVFSMELCHGGSVPSLKHLCRNRLTPKTFATMSRSKGLFLRYLPRKEVDRIASVFIFHA